MTVGQATRLCSYTVRDRITFCGAVVRELVKNQVKGNGLCSRGCGEQALVE